MSTHRNLHRAALRYPRTLGEAFNTPEYAAAIQKYHRPSRLRMYFAVVTATLFVMAALAIVHS